MSVNISYNDTLHAYSVSPAMLVQDLMQEISEKQFLYSIKLKYGDIELMTDRPVSKYLVTQLTLCYDDKEVSVEINNVTFEVVTTTPDGMGTFMEKATPEMSIGQLKERISKKFISTRANWVLKKKEQVVPDKDLLKSQIDKKTFTVVLEDMTIQLKTLRNKTFSIQTRCDTTVLQFKQICDKTTKMNIGIYNLSLLFRGKRFGIHFTDGDRTLTSFGIKNGDSVVLLQTIRGC